MCTYITEKAQIDGSGKGTQGWFPLTEARVYYDHPHHTMADHTLNIDFVNNEMGIGARIAVELTEESARSLIEKIEDALEAAGKESSSIS